MNEEILTVIVGCDEAEPLLGVEPLHRPLASPSTVVSLAARHSDQIYQITVQISLSLLTLSLSQSHPLISLYEQQINKD